MLEFVSRLPGLGQPQDDREIRHEASLPKPKLGLALGGGAARGWAHIGILQAFEEADVSFDIIAGTSIGAVAGGCHAAGTLDGLEAFARGLNKRKLLGLLDINLRGTSLINGQKLTELLTHGLEGLRIEDLPKTFVSVATEIGTGHEIWLSRGDLVQALTASYALPGIFRPQRVAGRWLMDGTLVNPVPVSVCRAHGARLVVSVNLNDSTFGRGTVVHHPQAEISEKAESGEDEAAPRSMYQLFDRGTDATPPGISAVMMDALNIMQGRISRSRLAGDPPDISILPRVAHIGLYDFHTADECINLGREAAQKCLPDIKAAIEALSLLPR